MEASHRFKGTINVFVLSATDEKACEPLTVKQKMLPSAFNSMTTEKKAILKISVHFYTGGM